MRFSLALPILAVAALAASSALADPQAAPNGAPAAAADGPISTANAVVPPPPAPGQTPALLTAPPDSPLGWLPGQGPADDKKIHGQISAGFDSRGGQFYSGSVEGPIGDNAWMGIAVSQSKWRW